MVKLEFFFFKTTFFGHIIKKLARKLFGAWSFLLVYIQFILSEGPKVIVHCTYLGSRTMEVGPSRWTMEKCYVCSKSKALMNIRPVAIDTPKMWTSIFECCMIKCGSKNGHQKGMCVKTIGLCMLKVCSSF